MGLPRDKDVEALAKVLAADAFVLWENRTEQQRDEFRSYAINAFAAGYRKPQKDPTP